MRSTGETDRGCGSEATPLEEDDLAGFEADRLSRHSGAPGSADPNAAQVSGLFLINGLGMGNSTRCYALIQHLHAAGLRADVLTSGNGLHFFRNRPEINSLTPVESFFYGVDKQHQHLSTWRTVRSLGELRARARRKSQQVEAAIRRFRPAFCVSDSEYTLGPLRKRGIPVIALNNSDVVVSEYLARKNKPREILGQFWLVEYLDYLFHRRFADLVISPAAKPLAPRHPRVRHVGLIVRREIAEAALRAPARADGQPVRKITVMVSGSVLGQAGDWLEWLGRSELPYEISVVGVDGPSDGQVKFYGKTPNNTELLVQADMLVINAGFSAVSEALALGKPTLVIPVPRHAEQFINACQVVDLGLGALTTPQGVRGFLQDAQAINALGQRAKSRATVDFGGASQAAEILLDFLQKRGIATLQPLAQ